MMHTPAGLFEQTYPKLVGNDYLVKELGGITSSVSRHCSYGDRGSRTACPTIKAWIEGIAGPGSGWTFDQMCYACMCYRTFPF